MKQTTYFLILIGLFFVPAGLSAQAYAPFPGMWTQHFSIPDSGGTGNVLWSVRVDTAVGQGSNTVYFFNRILRTPSPDSVVYDCNGTAISDEPGYAIALTDQDNVFGSSFRMLPGGLVELYTTASDTFLLETQAPVGATWTFNARSGVTAEVLSIGWESFLGQSDSVKVIGLSTGLEFALSKSHGLVRGVALLPIKSGYNGKPYSTAMELWGVEDSGLGNSLPGFDRIFGLLEVDDQFQMRRYGYGSYGSSTTTTSHTILSKTVGADSYSYLARTSSLQYSENYIFSGGSSLDTIYTPSGSVSLDFYENQYLELELLPGTHSELGSFGGADIHTEALLLDDGRVRRYFTTFIEYDPCAGALLNFFPDSESSRRYEEGLGRVYRSNSGAGYSNSLSLGCYDTQFAGQYGTCVDLEAGAGIANPTPSPVDPADLATGVWGNATSGSLLLVPGDAAEFLSVWDVSGRKVMEMPISSLEEAYRIDVGTWRPGVYVFRVHRIGGMVESFRTCILH